MSYDVYLVMQTGPEIWAAGRNMTSNVGEMYRLALPATEERCAGLHGLHGMRAEVAVPFLSAAVEMMEADPERFQALNPANGWGSYEDALAYLRDLLADCRLHSGAIVEVST